MVNKNPTSIKRKKNSLKSVPYIRRITRSSSSSLNDNTDLLYFIPQETRKNKTQVNIVVIPFDYLAFLDLEVPHKPIQFWSPPVFFKVWQLNIFNRTCWGSEGVPLLRTSLKLFIVSFAYFWNFVTTLAQHVLFVYVSLMYNYFVITYKSIRVLSRKCLCLTGKVMYDFAVALIA